MPTNNTLIMLGLGAAALLFMNRGGSDEDEADQLAGAAMMAAGEGTSPDSPFQLYTSPSDPAFFFNQGGEMAKVATSSIPTAAAFGEDIGQYPGAESKPELEFQVESSNPPIGTSDISPTTPEFAGDGILSVAAASIWDEQAAIAEANFMPLLAVQTGGGGIKVLGSNVDISTLSSKEQFRAVNERGSVYTTTDEVLGEYVSGFNEAEYNERLAERNRINPTITSGASTDEDIGTYPGGGSKPELEFTVARSSPPGGTSDISPTTPQFAGVTDAIITPSTVWDQPQSTTFTPVPVSPLAAFFGNEGGAFGPSAIETVQSTILPEPREPAFWEFEV